MVYSELRGYVWWLQISLSLDGKANSIPPNLLAGIEEIKATEREWKGKGGQRIDRKETEEKKPRYGVTE